MRHAIYCRPIDGIRIRWQRNRVQIGNLRWAMPVDQDVRLSAVKRVIPTAQRVDPVPVELELQPAVLPLDIERTIFVVAFASSGRYTRYRSVIRATMSSPCSV